MRQILQEEINVLTRPARSIFHHKWAASIFFFHICSHWNLRDIHPSTQYRNIHLHNFNKYHFLSNCFPHIFSLQSNVTPDKSTFFTRETSIIVITSFGVTFSYAHTFISIKSLASVINPVVQLHPDLAHFIGYFCKHLVSKYPDS
jgi:hypothetical protein